MNGEGTGGTALGGRGASWHVPPGALRAWVEGTGGMAAGASVEQHLMRCAECRDAVRTVAVRSDEAAELDPGLDPGLDPALDQARDPALGLGAVPVLDFEAVWTGIREEIEPQRLNLMGRVLVRLGVRESDAILLSTAPSLTGAWIAGMVLVVMFSLMASTWGSGRGVAVFLLLAPLLPVAGVAAAYGAEADPTHELTLSAPYSKIRLLLLRTGAVVATCVPLTIVASVPIEGPWWVSVVWLLPALAFVLATLAAATFAPPVYAAAIIAVAWVGATLPALIRQEPLAMFDATALVTYAAIAVVATAVFTSRIKHLATDWRIG
jgi:hypothetical protein